MVLSPTLAEALLFQPSKEDPGKPPDLDEIPGEVISLTTSDGVRIQAWWYSRGGADEGASPRSHHSAPAVLFLHGNAGNISHRTPMARGLLRQGLSVLLLEYRGYGGSEGSPTEEGIYLDALAGYDFLLEAVGDSRNIVVLGRSMGGAVAARLAAASSPGALILESAFTSLHDMARALYPFLPGFLFRRIRGRFDTAEELRRVVSPTLVVHGVEDEIVPICMGRELFQVAQGAGSEWMEVPVAGHNDVFWLGGEKYFRVMGEFSRKHTGGGP
jgi:pimeloyl-ACP methyl ester carboxylesterase